MIFFYFVSKQISTVDAFQGGEKDLIILSCVRTDHIGFIDCDRWDSSYFLSPHMLTVVSFSSVDNAALR